MTKSDKQGIIQDITAQVSLRKLLNGIPLGVAILDTNFRIIELNNFLEAMCGYFSIDAKGVHHDYILRTNLPSRDSLLKKVLKNNESSTFSGDMITRNRKKLFIQFTISSFCDDNDTPAGLILSLEDITHKQETETQHLPYGPTAEIIGHSPQMLEIFELIPVLAQTEASILITGETGTGKDKIAEAIHKESARHNHPFIKINCGALPETLLESELFGHVKGAFTGATHNKPGLFKLAHGGTLFLTEIGDLPLPLQVKLLSVLDDREFYPVGGSKKIRVDVRIIAATHRSLQEHVTKKLFREDLFYRLNVLRIHLPALREREGDSRLLLDYFLKKFDDLLKKGARTFDKEALRILTAYPYPGNVREMRNIVEYGANISQEDLITPEHLPRYIFEGHSSITPADQNSERRPKTAAKKATSVNWKETEKHLILEALKQTRGNRQQAAKHLGWSRTTLWRKLKTHNITH